MVTTSGKAFLSALRKIPAQYPLAFGIVLSGMKTSFSDLLVQKVIERREQIDWKRNGAFATFGFLYLGGVQYSIYVSLFGRMFPHAAKFAMKPILNKLTDIRGMLSLLAQVTIDQCLHHPFMYFPAFYCTKELVMNPQRPDFVRCLKEYQTNMMEDLYALWKIWVPATLINFAFMPMHYRIPFTAGVSLLWTCVLSTMRGGDIEHAVDMVGGEVTGATLHMIEEDLLHSTSSNYLFTEPINLAPDRHHVVITASGRDRPGWVALLSRAVTDGGGSVTESRMVRLGDEFIIVMHVAVPFEQQKSIQTTIRNNKSLQPLNIKYTTIARRKTGTYQAPMSGVRIRCIGADSPGLLASISETIFMAGLSIENVHTALRRRNALHSSSNNNDTAVDCNMDFVCEIDCVAVNYMDQVHVEEMVHQLSLLKVQHHLDVCDIRVQRLPQIQQQQ